jgi:cell division protein FtsZ
VDTVIALPNDRLLSLAPRGTSFFDAFRMADDVLQQAVQGLSDIITTPGLINRDFSDIRAIMLGMGFAMMGTAVAEGENAALEAAKKAIRSPLLDEAGIAGARGILINITASSRLGIHEVNEACSLIRSATANEDVQINFGVVVDEALDDEVKITVIATGFQREVPSEIGKEMARAAPTPRVATPAFVAPPPLPAPMPPAPEMPVSNFFEEPAPAVMAPAPAPEPPPAPASKEEPALPFDDLEVPAVLRRSRQLFQ